MQEPPQSEEALNPEEEPENLSPEISSPKRRKKRSKALETIETVGVALLLAIFIRATVAEARFIPSGSMIPTLLIGDRLIVEKVSLYFSDPHRGDILVFYPPNPAEDPLNGAQMFFRWLGFTRDSAYIKRVIGLPGETVSVQNGQVLINGQALNEPYIKTPPFDEMPPTLVPEHQYFMMGDNRNNSRDSRVWGTLPRKNVIGKSFFRFWPPTRLGLL